MGCVNTENYANYGKSQEEVNETPVVTEDSQSAE